MWPFWVSLAMPPLTYRHRTFLKSHRRQMMIETIGKCIEKMWKFYFIPVSRCAHYKILYVYHLYMFLYFISGTILYYGFMNCFLKNVLYLLSGYVALPHSCSLSMAFQNYSYGTALQWMSFWIVSIGAPILMFIWNWVPGLELLVQCFSALIFILLLNNRSFLSVL